MLSASRCHFLLDYEVTIPMRGGTSRPFEVNGGKSMPDGMAFQIANRSSCRESRPRRILSTDN